MKTSSCLLLFSVAHCYSLVLVVTGAEQVQQGSEEVVDAEVKGNGRHHIIGFRPPLTMRLVS